MCCHPCKTYVVHLVRSLNLRNCYIVFLPFSQNTFSSICFCVQGGWTAIDLAKKLKLRPILDYLQDISEFEMSNPLFDTSPAMEADACMKDVYETPQTLRSHNNSICGTFSSSPITVASFMTSPRQPAMGPVSPQLVAMAESSPNLPFHPPNLRL